MNVAGLILAAGESRRMGFPKALLQYSGETFLDRLIGLFAGRCRTVTVVLGAAAEDIRARVARPATFAVNPQWVLGQTSSMQCGLRAVPAEAESVLFTLVDHPAVSSATIDKLLDDKLPDGAPPAGKRPLLRVPCLGNRRGHPIWFSRELIPEFLALAETGAARDVVRSHAAETEFLEVDDPGILADIDDAEAYRGLTGAGL